MRLFNTKPQALGLWFFFQTAFKLLVISFPVIVVYEHKGPKCLSEKRKMMNLPDLTLDCLLAIKI
ncbi:hypothetical protein GHI35_08615 [Neisseria meningitidis]|uniref:Uncharacterized protein n=1 Tax=Neisseria meningitidis TaxID=487 RepID=A0AB36RU43_NEIME|nr:hypothetical protein A6J51_03135 [Neisseria meningitidis]ATL35447.1 hypothetical protein CQR35_11395 [Neisseria meningitidis]ATL37602.1 hypothetical protein CQR34_01310 [Neisseria meningitidis]MBG8856928.1 hypothetical protein [Neisseria meningitidis]MBG8865302.1 hypothetical protein [Neisseria meningitidis]